MDLQGQRVLVFGVLGRAGTAVARKLCQERASVMLSARREEEGGALTTSLRDEGFDAHFVAADVTQREQVAGAVGATVEQLGGVDVLVNCVSYDHMRFFMDDEERHWDKVHDVNVKGTMRGCQEALRHMIPQKYGRIINISSVEGKMGVPGMAGYTASKHGVNGLTKSAASEGGRSGITVNAICPGLILTDAVTQGGPGTAAAMGMSYDEMVDNVFKARTMTGELNTVEQVAELTVLLASEIGGGFTGALISLDGGISPY
jgi:3-hydroxybutyrate dehydrogenase